MELQLPRGLLDLSVPLVMGVLNLTPDSFSDGGHHFDAVSALRRAESMVTEGASIIDVGGESTRPGADAVPEQQELDRVIPVVERLTRSLDVIVSIDTMKPAVMRAACQAGAQIINDVNALRAPGAIKVAEQTGAAICLMHMQGEPRTMQQAPKYTDVVGEVRQFFVDRMRECMEGGIVPSRLLLDPGIGFGKTLEHNLRLLSQLPQLAALGRPLLVGVSRKSMFQQLLGRAVAERLPASLGASSVAAWLGAAIVRAHDVRATADAIAVVQAIRNAAGGR